MGSASASSTPRRPRLSRALVVETARDLLDEDGLEAFSMNRLGDRLGVTAMAIYRHVADRAELEQAVAELVLEDLGGELISAGAWPEAVAIWMHRVRDHWRRHPWLGHLLGNRSQLSPPWLAALNRLAGILEAAGFSNEVVARELVRITRATAGLVVLENAAPLTHGSALLDGLPEIDRPRWQPLMRYISRYSDDDLFGDLVAETVARLHGEFG
jgi:TetR/AcrR family tetracycline transcriptional repressor